MTPGPNAARRVRLAWRSVLARLGSAGRRVRSTATGARVAFLAVFVVYVVRYALYQGPRVGGDGFYSWIFARSLAFDGDLHLANDYAVCGDPWHMGVDEGGGRPANPFYLGPAMLWAPVLRLMRALVPLGTHPPASWTNGCDGPWVTGTLLLAPLFSVLTLWLGYRIARRFCSERAALASMLVIAFCSPLLHFGTLVVSYSHVWAAFGAGLVTLTWLRATERPESTGRWLVAGIGVGIAALMRNQAVILLLSPAITLAVTVWTDLRARRSPLRPVVNGLVVLAGFAVAFWPQLVSYEILYGHYWVVPQGHSYLQLASARPIMLLFAPRSGLLYWHPMMWLGVLGFIVLIHRRSTRLVGIALLLPLAVDVYVSASAYWHGGASFGARRLTTLAAPFVATGGVFLAWAWQWLRARPGRMVVFAATGWLLPWAIVNFGASSANVDGTIAYDAPVPAPELYGGGLRYGLQPVYGAVGNPFVLPASAVFALRYGVAPARFDSIGTGGMFEHAYRPVRLQGPDTIWFREAAWRPMFLEGMARSPEGVLVRAGTRGRMLVELAWSYVTDVQIDARSTAGGAATVQVTNRSFFTSHAVGTLVVGESDATHTVTIAPGTFVTGVNELVFDVTGGDVLLTRWQFIDHGVHDSSID